MGGLGGFCVGGLVRGSPPPPPVFMLWALACRRSPRGEPQYQNQTEDAFQHFYRTQEQNLNPLSSLKHLQLKENIFYIFLHILLNRNQPIQFCQGQRWLALGTDTFSLKKVTFLPNVRSYVTNTNRNLNLNSTTTFFLTKITFFWNTLSSKVFYPFVFPRFCIEKMFSFIMYFT